MTSSGAAPAAVPPGSPDTEPAPGNRGFPGAGAYCLQDLVLLTAHRTRCTYRTST
ncbi:hypothetical protein ACWD5Q_14950 [Streptomyces sp. NPDC002513]